MAAFDRNLFEAKLAKVIGGKLNGQFKHLVTLIGDPPDIANVPPGFWKEIGTDLSSEIRPIIAQTYAESEYNLAQEILGQYKVTIAGGVDWTLVNKQAAVWAANTTYDLGEGVGAVSQARVRDAISSFFEQDWSMDDLRSELEKTFGPERAAMIARTEITNAANWGEWGSIQYIEDNSSLQMVSVWHTDEDEHVCPICDALDGQEEDGRNEAGEPYWICAYDNQTYSIGAAHPRCRCTKGYKPKGW